jgi:hypothetical protein
MSATSRLDWQSLLYVLTPHVIPHTAWLATVRFNWQLATYVNTFRQKACGSINNAAFGRGCRIQWTVQRRAGLYGAHTWPAWLTSPSSGAFRFQMKLSADLEICYNLCIRRGETGTTKTYARHFSSTGIVWTAPIQTLIFFSRSLSTFLYNSLIYLSFLPSSFLSTNHVLKLAFTTKFGSVT